MQLKKGQIVEVDIYALAFGGAGIGKYEGLAVFVNGTMIGDKVKASFTKIKKNFAEATLVEIVSPSKDRVKPICPYFDVCGGCQLQFMPYEKQLEMKEQQVIDSFERIGKFKNPPVKKIIGCDEQFYYRNKMEFSFGYDKDMNFSFGLHLPNRRYDILDIDKCYLQSEFSNQILNKVREFALDKKWLPYMYSTNDGLLRSLFIREGKRTGEFMINFSTSSNISESFKEELKEFVDEILKISPKDKKLASVYLSQTVAQKGAPTRIKELLIYGKKTITEKMILKNGDTLTFDILPQAFFQINTLQAEILYSQIIEMATIKNQKIIFDLFCGTGTIGLFLAKHSEKVLGVELNESAIKSANENAQKNKIFNIDFYIGDVNNSLKTLRENPSLIVVDPPRAGLTEKIVKQMNELGAPQIIYVSCNPATLARDCEWLSGYGYKIKNIQPVDMFPHTYHIENVCLLER